MADISKISPDGGTTEYNIKDSTARADVSTINGKIPSGASSSNKMATASDVAGCVDWSSYAVTGAKNIMKFPYNGGVSGNNIFTINKDGSITIAAGTHSTRSYIYLANVADAYATPKGRWTISVEGIVSGISLKADEYNGSTWVYNFKIDDPSNPTFTNDLNYDNFDRLSIFIDVAAGTVLSEAITVKPMISVNGGTYVAPAMTNRELTENFPTAYSTSGLVFTNCTYVSGGYAKVGKLCVVNIRVLTDADMTGKDILITGFPSYSGSLNNKNIVPCNALNMSDDSNTNYYSAIGYIGNMNVRNSSNNIVPSKEYAISATYLCG